MTITVPTIDIIQLDNAIDPSGTRDLGAGASGFIKFLDTSSSGHLDFGQVNITTSGSVSATNLIFFRPVNMGTAQEIYNFRFHVASLSAWATGTYNFLWRNQIGFESGVGLTTSDDNVPTALPTSGNVVSTASGNYIQAVAESGCSQYIYLAVFADTDVPVGTYGGPSNGGFRFRVTYDFI